MSGPSSLSEINLRDDDTAHALLLRLTIMVADIDRRLEAVDDRMERRFAGIESVERELKATARRLADTSTKLAWSAVMAAVAPTPLRLALVAGCAVLGGFLGQIAAAAVHLR